MKYPGKLPKPELVQAALYFGGADVAMPTITPSRATGNQAKAKGLSAESDARAIMRREGYTVMQSQSSLTPADFMGVRQPGVQGPLVRAVQVKKRPTFQAWDCNDAVKEFIGLAGRKPYVVDEGCTREVWYRVNHLGWVARVVIDHLGAVSVTGTKAQEVEQSVSKMLAKASRSAAAKRSTFSERLTSCQ